MYGYSKYLYRETLVLNQSNLATVDIKDKLLNENTKANLYNQTIEESIGHKF